MLKTSLIAVSTLLLMVTGSQAAEWNVDVPHSTVYFKVSHLVISKVVGKFTDISGQLNFDGKDVSEGTAELTLAVSSVDTENEDRDKHLRSADFFDVEKFPHMTFKSTKVIAGEGGKFQLVGNLTIRDVTKEVTFDCEFNGSAEFMGTTKAGFTARTTINRQDFSVSWSRTMDSGGLVVGNNIDVTLELEFNKVG